MLIRPNQYRFYPDTFAQAQTLAVPLESPMASPPMNPQSDAFGAGKTVGHLATHQPHYGIAISR